jgi:adenine-specific DNA-methyltransferase
MIDQLPLNLSAHFSRDAYEYGARASGETHGVVLTKPHIVEFILDLAGYTSDHDLGRLALLEPSCGHGAFLIPAVSRLLASAERAGRPAAALAEAVLAFDIEREHVDRTREALLAVLHQHKIGEAVARRLVEAWVREGDFLLASFGRAFDFVVGNPPYVRIEQMSAALQAEYRSRYSSLYDRADLYVAFIQRGLSLLSPEGSLSFICADRWVSNKYGAPLREMISMQFRLRYYVDLHKASPFESEVIAYPSIFVLGRGKTERVSVISLDTASAQECATVAAALTGQGEASGGTSIATYDAWFEGDAPWVLSSPEHLRALRALEARFAPIEATARVGIGVATGNDKIYIVKRNIDVEQDRLVPLVMREDVDHGRIKDAGRYVINTFRDDGRLVDLRDYPKLKAYLDEHMMGVKKRHVAQKNPGSWFRTIDRVYPDLVPVPKLLIPDIAGSNEVALETGHYHPHHNLYFVTSSRWNMEILGGLLSSRVALFFVWSYAVKMRGGYLRFQAQYLRRIRLPDPDEIPDRLARELKSAFRERDFARLDRLALEAYELEELPPFNFVDTRK